MEVLSFAIVTPTLNHAQYLPCAIDSVLLQNYAALDYLVMDGVSTDSTHQVLARYAGQIRSISAPDAGQADAINRGIAQTHGDIITWLNADDEFAPGTLQEVARIFQQHPEMDVVYGNADFIDNLGNIIAPCAHVHDFDSNQLLHESDFLVQPATFVRRTAFDAVGGVDASLHWAFDYDLWLKLAAAYRFSYVPITLARYRYLAQSKTATGSQARLDEIAAVVARQGISSLPTYFRLEAVRLYMMLASTAMIRWQPALALTRGWHAARLLLSIRVLRSLLNPRTWRVMWTGHRLRLACSRAAGFN